MSEKDLAGISFGFVLILIWLVGLTSYLVYDKMIERPEVQVLLNPPLEVIEVLGE